MKEEVRNADASATLNLQITGEFTAYLETFGETQVFTCSGVDSVLSQSRIQNSDHRLPNHSAHRCQKTNRLNTQADRQTLC